MEQFVMSEHTALRISDSQQGQTVLVLLHGYLESLEIWEDFAKLLSPHYRIVTIDIPGHGISEVKSEIHTMEFIADVLRGVLDQKQITHCFVAGHSMGGYAAEAFAAKNNPLASLFDGLGIGLGFTIALTLLGSVRELLGTGKVFGLTLFSEDYGMLFFILAPGAFIALGYLIAIVNKLKNRESEG